MMSLRHGRHGFLAILSLLGGALTATARADDFQVNTYTPGDQIRPSVAMDADGDFVVVWQSEGSAGSDSWGYSIQGQRFAADGSPAGGEFQVNTYTSDDQAVPWVAMDGDGDFVVVWGSDGSSGSDSSSESIQAQRYAADGSALGGQFQVNTYTLSVQRHPAVAAEANGDFVVVWQSYGTDSSDWSIQAQRYSSDGSPIGGEFQVNTFTNNYQLNAAVAMDADGDFVVVWDSIYGHKGQRFASDGSPAGSEFRIDVDSPDVQFTTFPAVAMDADGGFVVSWESYGSPETDTLARSAQARIYAADGSPVGDQFQVNTYTTADQRDPSVAMDADGDFAVVWPSRGSTGTDSSLTSIQARTYEPDGTADAVEFQVNTYTSGGQLWVAAAMDADGDFVAVWLSGGSGGTDTSGVSIQGRLLNVSRLFSDGFETGDTSAWSSTVP